MTLAIAVALSAAGCWPWHGKSPQQQYAEALMRGNAMEASQLWLNMSPENRMKFSRGEGITADPASQDEVRRQILTHYENQMEGGPRNAEEMEEQIPTGLGASIQRLPEAAASSPPPQPAANGE